MRFKVRNADKIVGFFIILSLAILAFVIVMLGQSQRWFARDLSFTTILPSAAGLSRNMTVQYRGFTIGNVKDFYLTGDDEVEVVFVIHEEYSDRARLGSMVEMMISPVGLGSQFLFHSGNGQELEDGAFVPVVGSAEARELVRRGLIEEPRHDDSISVLMTRVNVLLDELGQISALMNEALGDGSDLTEIGKIIGGVQRTIAGLEDIPGAVVRVIEETDIGTVLSDISDFTATLTDTDGEVYGILISSLTSISSSLDSLDQIVAFVPSQLPQIAGTIADLRSTLQIAEDVLISLTNNPILRGGVPDRPSPPSGISPRGIRF